MLPRGVASGNLGLCFEGLGCQDFIMHACRVFISWHSSRLPKTAGLALIGQMGAVGNVMWGMQMATRYRTKSLI